MLDKTLNFREWEERLFKKTLSLFSMPPKSENPTFCMVLPPPNVTGTLHIGHAFNNTLQDIIARFKRLEGYDVLWQGGTDHAGIATQMVVERELIKEKLSRRDLGREEFLKRVWAWRYVSGDAILEQQKRLGLSLDWERLRFTMDEGLSKAVQKVFLKLYQDGLLYRAKRLVNWDPKFQTAISDLEVVVKETVGAFYFLKYICVDNASSFITVATTRPETLFGDVAVAVHPDDERYQSLVGKEVFVPLIKRKIPVIADTYCDPEKGTGAVKITPAHDFNDFEVGKRHNLPHINILNAFAELSENVPESYKGFSVAQARERVSIDLKEQGFLVGVEETISSIPYGDRSDVEIQPWLTDQWFVDMEKLAQKAMKVVEDKSINFIPESWAHVYLEWLKHIQPWCISRQLWWGHRIPAWYGPDGQVFVAESEVGAYEQAQAFYGHRETLTQDEDVLDTWFSSALWPFSTLGWPDQTDELARFYPTTVLSTGFDIIFFWVARMVMMGLYCTGKVPFKTVYMHALVRDSQGNKMSKSKGNVVDPLKIMDMYGTDAVRFTLSALASPGRDIKLVESRIEGYRNFTTKIWNAARFLQTKAPHINELFDPYDSKIELNQWIISMMSSVAEEVRGHLNCYRFDYAAQTLYSFLWNIFCDTYIEAIKPFLETPGVERHETIQTANWIFQKFLIMAHPFMPFVTDRLWEEWHFSHQCILNETWPKSEIHFESSYVISELMESIHTIRSMRGLLGLPHHHVFDIYAPEGSEINYMKREWTWFSKLGSLGILKIDPAPLNNIPLTVQGASFFLHSESFQDTNTLKELIQKACGRLEKEVIRLTQKVGNDAYKKAKPEEWQHDVDLKLEKEKSLDTLRTV